MTEPNDPLDPDSGVAPIRSGALWPGSPPASGDALVDGAMAALDDVPDSPVHHHGGLYSDIHDSLLAALETEPGMPTAPATISPEGNS
ncbi:hypothetical protein [Paenarthrobacter ilicis]|uniref:Uncharacterized protein n=1 Tax=Paenarthrobacter ilicis TaxID=43665 RepID=A0ABX0TKY2_9MICC|nr:hypothetical protein [Paenarthrobacter ilicis]MBM7792856.1 hypothetical protein [Paenarthrobacter ilicis]NIJ03232.1 hypothetical protein [Paenarthrobacter ilicis]